MNLQDEIKSLKERIAELEELAKEEQEFPQYGDVYWYIETKGKVLKERWDGFGFEIDVIEMGNVFRTEEQAKFALEKLKVEAELRKFSRPFEHGENNHIICIGSNGSRLFTIGRLVDHYQGAIYFESRDKAQRAIKSVGEDRIKKYIFGMED